MNKLNDIELSKKLIKDLYLDLRKNTILWSKITNQTPQARMGYIGQHLTSVVTGFKGGKSGARGYDLILSENDYGEIKTCYRIDQLGICKNCGNSVSSIENYCSLCNSNNIERKNDSKWLITLSTIEDYKNITSPKYYYFVLFEYVNLNFNNDIVAKIWKVDTQNIGFILCMIDYWHNIRAVSKSAAPFNCWPYQLKFGLMKPYLIYHSIIKENDEIETLLFPNINDEILEEIDFPKFSRAKTITLDSLIQTLKELSPNNNLLKSNNLKKNEILIELNNLKLNINYNVIIDTLAKNIYLPLIIKHKEQIPDNLKKYINFSKLY